MTSACADDEGTADYLRSCGRRAYAPGTYQCGGGHLFNMLYACGGPRDTGTLRAIQLRRAGGRRGALTYDFRARQHQG